MYDVITVGSGTVDMFVETGSKLFQEGKTEGFVKVQFGSKILVDNIKIDTGGGGTNTAVAFARLGFRTAWLGKTGDCENSDMLMKQMKDEKVNTSLVVREKGKCGISVIIDAKGHDRTILAYKGANDDLLIKEVNSGKLKSKWMYFCSMTGRSFKTQEDLAKLGIKNKIKIMYNPSSYVCKQGIKHIRALLKKSDILIVNTEEAGLLAGAGDPGSMARRLHKEVKEMIVITDGPAGAYAYDGVKLYYAKPHKITPIETTGAGDSFGAGFLAGWIMKGDVEFALQMGMAESENVILHFGAKNNLLKKNELNAYMKRKKTKVVKRKI